MPCYGLVNVEGCRGDEGTYLPTYQGPMTRREGVGGGGKGSKKRGQKVRVGAI